MSSIAKNVFGKKKKKISRKKPTKKNKARQAGGNYYMFVKSKSLPRCCAIQLQLEYARPVVHARVLASKKTRAVALMCVCSVPVQAIRVSVKSDTSGIEKQQTDLSALWLKAHGARMEKKKRSQWTFCQKAVKKDP